MRTSLHELTLNGLPLDDPLSVGDEGYSIRVLAEGFEPGSHEAVLSVVRALGADGSSVREEGADNAETSFQVEITGPDHSAVAAGRAALRRAFPSNGGTVELIHRPSDGVAPAAVRDVVHGEASLDWDDLGEIQGSPYRVYTVTLTHLPYVRSEFPSTIEAPYMGGPVATTAVVDECDSATGWSATTVTAAGASVAAPVTVASSAVSIEALAMWLHNIAKWQLRYTLRRTGAVSMSTTPYLVAEVAASTTVLMDTSLYVNGTHVPAMSSSALGSGYLRLTYDLTAFPSIATLEWQGGLTVARNGAPAPLNVRIRRILRTDNPNPTGTPRQSMRTLEVGGTERSPGSVHVAQRTGSDPLGVTLIHTSPHVPGGYDPDLTRWATTAGTADPTVPAGATWDLSADDLITLSPSSAYSQGPHVLYAYVRSTTTQSVHFSRAVAGSIPGGATFREIYQRSEYVTLTADKWTMVSIGLESLPAMRGPLGITWVVIGCDGAPGVTIGGFWAFSADDSCSLSLVDAEQPHLWIDSPKVGSAADVWCSATNDRYNGYYPSGTDAVAGIPLLSAGLTDVYVVTAGADNATVDYSHFRRWDDFPADDGTTP